MRVHIKITVFCSVSC